MKIKQIEFKRTVTKNFQSRTVGVVIEVGARDKVTDVQAAAEIYVATQLGEIPDGETMKAMKSQVTQYEAAQKLLKQIG